MERRWTVHAMRMGAKEGGRVAGTDDVAERVRTRPETAQEKTWDMPVRQGVQEVAPSWLPDEGG